MNDNLTISEVARAAGLSRVSVYKAVNNGELSVSVNSVNGVKTVSKSELARFLSIRGVKPLQSNKSKNEQVLTSSVNDALQAHVKALQTLLEAKEQVIAAKEQVIEEQAKRLFLLEDRREDRPLQQASFQSVKVPEPSQRQPAERKPRTLFDRLARAVKAGLEG